METSDTFFNNSSIKLSESEASILNKGLNFCPKMTKNTKE